MLHEYLGIIGQQGILLVLCHGIITSAKEILGDLAISIRFFVPSGGRLTVDNSNNTTKRLSLGALGSIHLLHLLLIGWVLTVVVLLTHSHALTHSWLSYSKVHKGFDRLLALGCLRLHLVEGVIQDLPVISQELAHLSEVDVNHLTFREKFTKNLENVQKNNLKGALVSLDVLGHHRVVDL